MIIEEVQKKFKNYIVSKLQRKRWALRLFLKIAVDREDFMYCGNLFQRQHLKGSTRKRSFPKKFLNFYQVPQEGFFFLRNQEISESGGGGCKL